MKLSKLDAVAQAKLRTTCVDFVNQCNAIAKGRGVDVKGMNLAFSVLAKWHMQDMFNSYGMLSNSVRIEVGWITKLLNKIINENLEVAWRDNYRQLNPEVKDESIPPIPTRQTEGQEEKGDTQSSGSRNEEV